MDIWIVNPFDNLPHEGLRPQRYWLMARAFASAGHKVTYWSADFSHAYKRLRDSAAMEGKHEGICLRLVHEPPYGRNICLKRLWSHWRFARNWLKASLNDIKKAKASRPDVLIASSPPLALGAAARTFCRRTGSCLIVDVQDAWPETFERVVPRFLLAPLAMLARHNYLAADAITAVATRYLDLVRSYGATCPTHLCYLGIECKMENDTTGHSQLSTPHSSFFRLAYIGNMSKSYDLATVVDAVREMPDVTLDLAGAGPDEPTLKARAAGCERIRFHGYLAEGDLRRLLAQSDAGVIPMFDDSCVGVPGKLADYSAAGLPVVNALTGETASLLSRYGAGVQYTAGDRMSFMVATRAVRHLEKRCAMDLSIEFDAGKLYNGYVIFVEKLFKRKGRVVCP